MSDLEYATKPAGEITISSAKLVDGTTYYVRAQGLYKTATSASNKTEYSDVMTFVYSAEQGGVEGVTSDDAKVYVNSENVVVLADAKKVEIYNIGGQLVESANVEGLPTFDINHLATGAYVIKVTTANGVVSLKHVK